MALPKTDKQITHIIKMMLVKPIKEIATNDYQTLIRYEDGIGLFFWSRNRYYAYAQYGILIGKDNEILFKWSGCKPKYHICKLLDLSILKHRASNFIFKRVGLKWRKWYL